jgi:oligoendopeptidase F
MATAAPELEDPELLDSGWDLSPLLDGDEAGGTDRLLEQAAERAQAFAAAYSGRVAELDGDGLRVAMRELAEISGLAGRAASYAALSFSTDTADPPRGALLARVQEQATRIATMLLFFELEWAALDDERADELLAAEDLDFCRHHLHTARRYRPYLLSEPEERVLTEKSTSSSAAWSRLFGELAAALRVELGAEPLSLELAMSQLLSSDRDTRRTAAEAIGAALAPGLRTRAFIYNTLVQDKAVEDRLRGYPHWLAARNLSNEVSDESVRALIDAVRGRYELPRRWYRLKAKLLGLDQLADYDRSAPLVREEVMFGYGEARDLVLDTYAAFSPKAGEITRRFFDEHWIDAPVRPNKRGGAFCSYTVPSVHPYVMLNFTARRRDVLVMAHELGHGLHAALAAPRGIFHQSTPLTLAETASVFGESLVFERMLESAADDADRLSLLADRIDGAIGTVFRQIAMNRFEHLVHTRRRREGELSPDAICDIWVETQTELFADSVSVSDTYRMWWSYIPHVINAPGYVYAYAYGQLLALSAYGRYRDEGESFVQRYLELLAAGGSKSPEELAAIVGIDLSDPGFWDAGLDLIEQELTSAERLAADTAGR